MSEKAESVSNPLDTVKWILVFIVLGGLVYAYTTFSDVSVLYRALGAVAAVVVAGLIAATTFKGQTFLTFAKDARTEANATLVPARTCMTGGMHMCTNITHI